MTLVGLCYIKEYTTEGYDSGYFKAGAVDIIDGAIKVVLSKLRP